MALEERGLTLAAICLMHSGARNIGAGAVTAHSLAQRHVLHGTFSGQVILTDEISFTSIDLLAALEETRLKVVRLLVFGDFQQLPPLLQPLARSPMTSLSEAGSFATGATAPASCCGGAA